MQTGRSWGELDSLTRDREHSSWCVRLAGFNSPAQLFRSVPLVTVL
jgi:hypothetical protein